MDPVVIPPDASWQQVVYAIVLFVVPALFTYLERLRRDIKDNTIKTERVNHSLNGELDKRLDKLRIDLASVVAKSISEETIDLKTHLNEMDLRLTALEQVLRKQ